MIGFGRMLMAGTAAGITQSGLVAELDAGDIASWSGSGVTWANLVASPADGSAKTAYDMQRGDGVTSTTYPTFNGTPGGLSSAEYWSFDGGDWFILQNAMTTFLNSWHKTGAAFSAMLVYQLASVATNQCLIGTAANSNEVGVYYGGFNSVNKNSFGVLRGVGGTTAINKEFSAILPTASWLMEHIVVSEAGSGFDIILDTYNQSGGSDTWTAAYTSPSASAATYSLHLGSNGNAGDRVASGGRLAYCALWNRALSATEVAANVTARRARWTL